MSDRRIISCGCSSPSNFCDPRKSPTTAGTRTSCGSRSRSLFSGAPMLSYSLPSLKCSGSLGGVRSRRSSCSTACGWRQISRGYSLSGVEGPRCDRYNDSLCVVVEPGCTSYDGDHLDTPSLSNNKVFLTQMPMLEQVEAGEGLKVESGDTVEHQYCCGGWGGL